MKKYFISFWWIAEKGRTGFSDTIRTSLNKSISIEDLIKWKEEIINSSKPIPLVGISILNYKEIKA